MRYFFHISLFFLLLSWQSVAQNNVRIDSLLNLLPEAKDTTKVMVLNELAWEYRDFQPNKAIEYGEKALELANNQNYKRGLAVGLRYMGLAYRSKLDFVKAQKHFFLALALEEQNKNKLGVAYCLNDIGGVYKKRGDYKQALDKYKRAVEIFEELGIKKGTASALSNIADAYYKLAKYNNALKFALRSLEIANQTGTNEGIRESSLILSESYASTGNFKLAYKYHLLYTHVRDSVFEIEKKREILLLEEKFDRERKETVAKMQAEKQAEIEKRDQQQRDNIQYSIIFIIFVLLIAGTLFLGKIDIPRSYVESLIFITSLLIIRFIIIIVTPYVEVYFESSPIFTLSINVILALLFMPIHRMLESRLKKKAIEEVSEEEKIRLNPKIKEKLSKLRDIKDKIITDREGTE